MQLVCLGKVYWAGNIIKPINDLVLLGRGPCLDIDLNFLLFILFLIRLPVFEEIEKKRKNRKSLQVITHNTKSYPGNLRNVLASFVLYMETEELQTIKYKNIDARGSYYIRELITCSVLKYYFHQSLSL